VVRAVRVSGKHWENFEEVIRDGNRKGWFKVGHPPKVVLLKELQLLQDIRTHWDSVYLMLNWLHEMRLVCCHYRSWPISINAFNRPSITFLLLPRTVILQNSRYLKNIGPLCKTWRLFWV
jgi:hypothetical protein